MAVVGAINDGLFGDISLLVTKAILDAIIVMVLSATMGRGCLFSAIPVAALQGLVTLFARFLKPVMTAQATAALALTGSVLVFCVGVNLIWDKRIPVANLLPTLLFAVALGVAGVRILHLRTADIFRAFGPGLAISLGVAAGLGAVRLAWPANVLWSVALASLAGALGGAATLRLLASGTWFELLGLVRRALPGRAATS